MKTVTEVTPEDPESTLWDAVVIGTGPGGGTAGYELARLGRSVLFIERGKLLAVDPTVVRGERRADGSQGGLSHGWWPGAAHFMNGGIASQGMVLTGCGVGGTSTVFSKVMDRMQPHDFTPGQYFHDAAESTVPEAWPISYEELDPFYERAERLYGVHGTPDPLNPRAGGVAAPAPPSPNERAIFGALADCGLHPYRIHYAESRVPECHGCRGMLCPHGCRNDAGKMCVRPAMEQHGANILSECRVESLTEVGGAVRTAVCLWNGRRIEVRARVFVLAANAVMTPTILLRSANQRFRSGLANSSGLVGRNLMMHFSDYLACQLRMSRHAFGDLPYGIALNDFYLRDGVKMGTIQAHAIWSGRGETAVSIEKSPLKRLPSTVKKVLARAGAAIRHRTTEFATIVEDLPYAYNRVVLGRPGGDDVAYEYYIDDEIRVRNWSLVDGFRRAIDRKFTVRPMQPLGYPNFSHICGTCRFGDDPAASVLDRNNRAHDLSNLYVLDASFFPSSSGINPSLTIAANSLRAAGAINASL